MFLQMLDPGFPLVAEALALCLTLKINAETFTYVTKILISQLLLGSLNRKMGLHLFFHEIGRSWAEM